MPPRMTTCTITRLGHLGDGIADGPVYAARTLPGEVVSGVLFGDELTDIRVETPSPDRVLCGVYFGCLNALRLWKLRKTTTVQLPTEKLSGGK